MASLRPMFRCSAPWSSRPTGPETRSATPPRMALFRAETARDRTRPWTPWPTHLPASDPPKIESCCVWPVFCSSRSNRRANPNDQGVTFWPGTGGNRTCYIEWDVFDAQIGQKYAFTNKITMLAHLNAPSETPKFFACVATKGQVPDFYTEIRPKAARVVIFLVSKVGSTAYFRCTK